jgi:glycerophosphoryl diester phosphodiesterase
MDGQTHGVRSQHTKKRVVSIMVGNGLRGTRSSERALIIAHRGESYNAPENTLAAVNLAWKRNADAVEVDVHLTKDGKIVVIHDDNTWRTAHTYGKVSKLTLEQLKLLDVGAYKGERWAREKIPALEEVVDTVPKGKQLFVEIKGDVRMLEALKCVLENSSVSPEQLVLIGMDLTTMETIKKHLPPYQVCWVCAMKDGKDMHTGSNRGEELITRARQAGLDGLNIKVSKEVDKDFIARVKSAGMKLYVWTVNDLQKAQRLFEAGADGITTDRAQWLKARLQRS